MPLVWCPHSLLLEIVLTKDQTSMIWSEVIALGLAITPQFNLWSTGSHAPRKFARLNVNTSSSTASAHWYMLVPWTDHLQRCQMTNFYPGTTSRPLFWSWAIHMSRPIWFHQDARWVFEKKTTKLNFHLVSTTTDTLNPEVVWKRLNTWKTRDKHSQKR